MLKHQEMKYWTIKEWQLYLHELGFGISEAGEQNKKWYFITQGKIEKNKITKKREMKGGIKFILPNPWRV